MSTKQAQSLIDAAAENSGLAKLDKLLAAGVPADAKNEEGETALFRSAGNNTLKIAARLLAAGANPDLVAIDGMTPRKIAGGAMKKLFAAASTAGGAPSLRATVSDDVVIKRARVVIAALLAKAKELKGHTIYCASLDEEDVKVASRESFAEMKAARDVTAKQRLDPSTFAFAAPYPSRGWKGDLETKCLAPKKKQGPDGRTEDDLVCELVAANRAVLATKLALADDFQVIAPGHAY